MGPEPIAPRRNWREMDMLAAGWVPPEAAKTLAKAVKAWVKADSGSISDRQRARVVLHDAWDEYRKATR